MAPADRAESGGIHVPQGLATASLELQPVVDQSHAAAHAVLGKPNSYNQAREKSAMTISGGRTFRPGRLFRIQGGQDDRAVCLQPLREHLIVRACSQSGGMQRRGLPR